jgi:hypothetical protein
MGTKRLTYAQAAHALGISIDAARMRVRRGTLRSERDETGVRVILDADQVRQDPDETTLTAQLRSEVEYLREETRRKDHLIAALIQKVPALEAPSNERADVDASREETTGAYSGTGSREDSEKPASWWRRIFGG